MFFTAGSVLLNDELYNGQSNGDVAINMDVMDKQRYQQQLQLIDEQVRDLYNTRARRSAFTG
jgi:hypothetical protein